MNNEHIEDGVNIFGNAIRRHMCNSFEATILMRKAGPRLCLRPSDRDKINSENQIYRVTNFLWGNSNSYLRWN